MRKESGATLVEVIVSLSIAAIITTQAVAAYSGLVRRNHLTAETNRMISALALARSEAIKRNLRVTLCASTDGSSCNDSSGFDRGWIVFEDSNQDAGIDPDEPVIAVFTPDPDNSLTIRGNRPVSRYVSYVPSGVSRRTTGGFQAGTITLCNGEDARQIVISATGRARSAVANCAP